MSQILIEILKTIFHKVRYRSTMNLPHHRWFADIILISACLNNKLSKLTLASHEVDLKVKAGETQLKYGGNSKLDTKRKKNVQITFYKYLGCEL